MSGPLVRVELRRGGMRGVETALVNPAHVQRVEPNDDDVGAVLTFIDGTRWHVTESVYDIRRTMGDFS